MKKNYTMKVNANVGKRQNSYISHLRITITNIKELY